QQGNPGWSYKEVLPYFIKSETNQRGESEFHGGAGPLKVSDIGQAHELIEAFIHGAEESGVPRTADFNGVSQEGAGYYQLTTWKGWRCSTATAYLKPARKRANLKVDRKSTRLNSSHVKISYAVFCLKKKNKKTYRRSR